MNAQVALEETTADDQAKALVRDLHRPNPRIFWADLLATAFVTWTAFVGAVVLSGVGSLAALVTATFALYRGLCFIHEITHIRPRALPGFEPAWNFLFGVPLLLPTFMYVGVHQDHHKISTYGTSQDPEYLPFSESNAMVVFFVAHSVLIPLFLLVRFLVLAPLGLLFPPLHRWLAVHASALSMNFRYERDVTNQLLRRMYGWEIVTFAVAAGALAAMSAGVLPWRVLLIWYSASAGVCLVNTLRTLVAHHYESDGEPLDRQQQLLDSIDVPGGMLTGLWAPVGLRYHALHHYFPGIPYHNLGEAHRRLLQGLPSEAAYRRTIHSGLWQSLADLYRTGGARASRQSSKHAR